MYLLKSEIQKLYRDAGVGPGSHVILQSSYKGMGVDVEGKAAGIFDAVLDLVGSEGSVITAAYNHTSWTAQHYFDIRETPTDIGIVAELFRQDPRVRRTKHPIHSLAVAGKLQDELCELEYTDSFGPDSVWTTLLKYDVICTTIGLGTEMAFLPCHYAETQAAVPYRRFKNFSGIYVGEDGSPALRSYGFHVRKDLSRPPEPYVEAHGVLVDRRIVHFAKYRSVRMYWCPMREYHESFHSLIEEMPGLFL